MPTNRHEIITELKEFLNRHCQQTPSHFIKKLEGSTTRELQELIQQLNQLGLQSEIRDQELHIKTKVPQIHIFHNENGELSKGQTHAVNNGDIIITPSTKQHKFYLHYYDPKMNTGARIKKEVWIENLNEENAVNGSVISEQSNQTLFNEIKTRLPAHIGALFNPQATETAPVAEDLGCIVESYRTAVTQQNQPIGRQPFEIGFDLSQCRITSPEEFHAAMSACLKCEEQSNGEKIITGIDEQKRQSVLEAYLKYLKEIQPDPFLTERNEIRESAGTVVINAQTHHKTHQCSYTKPFEYELGILSDISGDTFPQIVVMQRTAANTGQAAGIEAFKGFALPGGRERNKPPVATESGYAEIAARHATQRLEKIRGYPDTQITSWQLKELITVSDTEFFTRRFYLKREEIGKLQAQGLLSDEVTEYYNLLPPQSYSQQTMDKAKLAKSKIFSATVDEDEHAKMIGRLLSSAEINGATVTPVTLPYPDVLYPEQWTYQHEYLGVVQSFHNKIRKFQPDSSFDTLSQYLQQATHRSLKNMLDHIVNGRFPSQVELSWSAEQIFTRWTSLIIPKIYSMLESSASIDLKEYASSLGTTSAELKVLDILLERICLQKKSEIMNALSRNLGRVTKTTKGMILGTAAARTVNTNPHELFCDPVSFVPFGLEEPIVIPADVYDDNCVRINVMSGSTYEEIKESNNAYFMQKRNQPTWWRGLELAKTTKPYEYTALKQYIRTPSPSTLRELVSDPTTGQIMKEPHFFGTVHNRAFHGFICDKSSINSPEVMTLLRKQLNGAQVTGTYSGPISTLRSFIESQKEYIDEMLKRATDRTEPARMAPPPQRAEAAPAEDLPPYNEPLLRQRYGTFGPLDSNFDPAKIQIASMDELMAALVACVNVDGHPNTEKRRQVLQLHVLQHDQYGNPLPPRFIQALPAGQVLIKSENGYRSQHPLPYHTTDTSQTQPAKEPLRHAYLVLERFNNDLFDGFALPGGIDKTATSPSSAAFKRAGEKIDTINKTDHALTETNREKMRLVHSLYELETLCNIQLSGDEITAALRKELITEKTATCARIQLSDRNKGKNRDQIGLVQAGTHTLEMEAGQFHGIISDKHQVELKKPLFCRERVASLDSLLAPRAWHYPHEYYLGILPELIKECGNDFEKFKTYLIDITRSEFAGMIARLSGGELPTQMPTPGGMAAEFTPELIAQLPQEELEHNLKGMSLDAFLKNDVTMQQAALCWASLIRIDICEFCEQNQISLKIYAEEILGVTLAQMTELLKALETISAEHITLVNVISNDMQQAKPIQTLFNVSSVSTEHLKTFDGGDQFAARNKQCLEKASQQPHQDRANPSDSRKTPSAPLLPGKVPAATAAPASTAANTARELAFSIVSGLNTFFSSGNNPSEANPPPHQTPRNT